MDVREKLEVIAHLGDHITYKEDIGICYDSDLAKVIEDAYMELKSGVTVQDNTEISDELLKQLKNSPITVLHEEPTIETVQEWISVKDRLPEVATSHNTRWDKSTDSIRVLCACVQADGKKMVKEGYCKVYSDGFIHWKIPGTIHSVTHWHYLPQPPKGD